MSQWTHVNGIIRIDAIRTIGFGNKPNIGIPSQFDDDHQSRDIPTGSEGSLYAELWISPNNSSLATYTVSIFGDLRDYNYVEDIVKYLNQITHKQMVRSGVCEIHIERGFTYVYQYIADQWVEISKIEDKF